MGRELAEIAGSLRQVFPTKYYEVRYNYRHFYPGRGEGISGVRGQGMVSSYVDGLERLYRAMTGPVFNRQRRPKTGADGLIPVLVCEVSEFSGRNTPCTVLARNDIRTILLPCRSCEPSLQTALNRAAADAVHEATHAFNFAIRDGGPKGGNWWWFNEATAVFMEGYVLPGNPETIYFHMDWVDQPETSLDSGEGYQAAMFVHYLVQRYREPLLTAIWEQSEPLGKPLEALERLREDGPGTEAKKIESCGIFADYCLDAYFTCDPKSHCFKPELYARFGWRMIGEAFRFPGKAAYEVKGIPLSHLACRYYRVELRDGGNLNCWLVARGKGAPQVEARLAVVQRDLCREGDPIVFTQTAETASDGEWTANFAGPAGLPVDHLVIVVSNSSLYEDVEFDLRVSV